MEGYFQGDQGMEASGGWKLLTSRWPGSREKGGVKKGDVFSRWGLGDPTSAAECMSEYTHRWIQCPWGKSPFNGAGPFLELERALWVLECLRDILSHLQTALPLSTWDVRGYPSRYPAADKKIIQLTLIGLNRKRSATHSRKFAEFHTELGSPA